MKALNFPEDHEPVVGNWRTTPDIAVSNVVTRDIYRSPLEPSYVSWAILWKERSGALKLSFVEVCRTYYPEEVIPSVYLTPEIQQEMSTLYTDLHGYVEQMKAKWIIDGGIDGEWEDFHQKLKAMKVDRYVAIYQDVFDKGN